MSMKTVLLVGIVVAVVLAISFVILRSSHSTTQPVVDPHAAEEIEKAKRQ
jgi:MFS superfamily sulfate permease-like transporter